MLPHDEIQNICRHFRYTPRIRLFYRILYSLIEHVKCIKIKNYGSWRLRKDNMFYRYHLGNFVKQEEMTIMSNEYQT